LAGWTRARVSGAGGAEVAATLVRGYRQGRLRSGPGKPGGTEVNELPFGLMPDKNAEQLVDEAFRRHRGQVYRYLLRRTGHHADAEDLTQKVFADAVAALQAGSRPDSLLAWLYTVAERRFVDYLRRLKARPETWLSDRLADPHTLEYGGDIAAALAEALNRLPEPQQKVIVMKLFEDRSFAEIAETLGLQEGAAKMRFSRGLASLREDLRAGGFEP
jgi:RNA polymerase sigma-70 factor (ECF subfamily)